jgi:hypothetical protein
MEQTDGIGICARFIFGRANYRYFPRFRGIKSVSFSRRGEINLPTIVKYPVSSTVVKKAASGLSRQAGYDTLV